ncbi:hypothetical protein LshimejAT787_0606520 [Lyophyllum shimeji]|uniref:Uncharacterized protein n=1 Tax=Lyophyllum shimeji TaxID=47721 RepID=A0A9P3PJK1_LYOSH|nr:hypothetical protein LshimejAT787_0312230 [Lyophyllum shimeji]GLB39490.1 hypothetical protein LshimejAT787_0606520 [Lyophyllum shimeji]
MAPPGTQLPIPPSGQRPARSAWEVDMEDVAEAATKQGTASGGDQTASNARYYQYQAASTLSELLAVIPSDYRVALKDPLVWVQQTARKLAAARSTVARWESLKARNELPAHLSKKTPAGVQLSSLYASTAEGQNALAQVRTKAESGLHDVFAKALDAKQADVEHLQSLLKPEALWNRFAPILNERWVVIKGFAQRPIFESSGPNGESRLSDWITDPDAVRIYDSLKSDLVPIAIRAWIMVENQELLKESKMKAKKSLKADMDVDMEDVTLSSDSVRKMVKDAVKSALSSSSGRKQADGKSKTGKRSKRSSQFPEAYEEVDSVQELGFEEGREGEGAFLRIVKNNTASCDTVATVFGAS